MIKDRLVHYSKLVGPHGDSLASLFRFQKKPNSDYPKIYLPFDSLLNHKSRLIRNTHRWLGEFLTREDIFEVQCTLACHDVPELVDGDVSRLAASDLQSESAINPLIELLLLPDDVTRYRDFLVAEDFLEHNGVSIPDSFYSLIARMMDTIDGNYFAFALLENYAIKVWGDDFDSDLQKMLDRSYAYVNKMRLRYRERIALLSEYYDVDLDGILDHLQKVEVEKIDRFSETIEAQGYRTASLV